MFFKKTLFSLSIALLSAPLWAGAGHDGHAHMQPAATESPHGGHGGHDGHGGHQHGATLKSPAGTPGKAEDATRTIRVEALDTMMYKHEPLQVKAGETVRFEVTNKGRMPHEFAIGVAEEHRAHQEMMRENPTMTHDDPNVVTLAPGETKTLVWTFAKAQEIEVACNIPGHYEGGMHSSVQVN